MLAKITAGALLILSGATVIYIIYKVILAWTSAQVTKKREIGHLENFQAHPDELPKGKPQNNLPLIDPKVEGPHEED